MPEEFDRNSPRYRVFDLTQEAACQAYVWFVIDADKRVGRECTDAEKAELFRYVEEQPWASKFWIAYDHNKKATLYDPVPDFSRPVE